MLLDSRVERRKFAEEVALLNANVARLRALGVWIVRAEQPEIDLLLVPHLPLRVGFLQATTPSPSGLLVTPGQSIQAAEFLALGARAFGVRFDLGGYDQRPPSITFRDPWSWELAPYVTLPIGQLVDDPTKPQVVLLDAHPALARPFLCLRGVREYHEHPQHDGDDWLGYRGATNIYVLVERIARITLASVRPLIVIAFGNGQMQVNLQWQGDVPR